MRNIRNITILKAIMHIADMGMDKPVLNSSQLYLTDDTLEFIGKHIAKVSNDEEAEIGEFNKNSVLKNIIMHEDDFIKKSHDITNFIFKKIKDKGVLPSGDVLVIEFECEYGKKMAILLLNFIKTFTHSIETEQNDLSIDVKSSFIGLPDPKQRLYKAAIVSLDDSGEEELLILNRQSKVEKDSKVSDVFTNNILECSLKKDSMHATKIFSQISEKFIRENFSDDAGKAQEKRNNIDNVLLEDDNINITEFSKEVFGEEYSEQFVEMLKENDIKENVEVDKEWVGKKRKRKRIKIDKDIEINIDIEAYKDINRVQFKKNGDGTVDVIIRQVRNYFEKQ